MIMQLRKAVNHPYLFDWPVIPGTDQYLVDASITTASGKMLLLERLLPALFADNHKVLIFSQFTTMLDIIEDWAIQLHQWQCCRIDGGVSQGDRQQQIKSFNTDKDVKLFLLSTRAGGLGINLTAADTVVIFDSDWNPQQDLQAQDRAHRIGQTKVHTWCNVTDLSPSLYIASSPPIPSKHKSWLKQHRSVNWRNWSFKRESLNLLRRQRWQGTLSLNWQSF
jgi:SNF2 family DNA or RNA helicase